MKLIKDDINAIISYKKTGETYFKQINGQQALKRLHDRMDTIRTVDNSRETKLKLIADLLAFRENCLASNGKDPVYNVENLESLTSTVCKGLDMPEYYIDIANMALTNKQEIQKIIPEYEQSDLDENKLKSLGIDVDANTLTENIRSSMMDERQQMVDTEKAYIRQNRSVEQQGLSDLVFDNNAFQQINNVKDSIARQIKNDGLSASELLDSFNSKGGRESVEQQANAVKGNNFNAFDEHAREVAAQKIGVYQALKDRIDKKTFVDYLLHPIKSFQESRALNTMKNNIKEDYKLSDDNLDKIAEVISSEGKLNNIGILHREDSSVVYNQPTVDELAERKDLYWQKQKDAVMSQKDLDNSISDMFEKSNNKEELVQFQEEPTKQMVKENSISND